jgi:hypothetical protein
VLDVAGRPKTLGGWVVALVEKRIEGLNNKCFVLLLNCDNCSMPFLLGPVSLMVFYRLALVLPSLAT